MLISLEPIFIRVEQSVFKLLRTQNIVVAQYKESNIPAKWMLEPELVGKVRLYVCAFCACKWNE